MAHIKLSEDEIIRVLDPMMSSAEQWMQEKSDERIKCYRYYHQEVYGNERDGWSKTVASTVFDVIEWLKPGLNEIFASPDFFALKAAPSGGAPGEGIKKAEKVKQYIRYLLFRKQDGEEVIDDYVSDSLLYHNGVIKIYYHEEYDTRIIKKSRMTMDEFNLLAQDKNVTITRYDEVQEYDRANNYYWEGVENVTAVIKELVFAGPKIEVVPPWEFYTLPGTKAIDRNTKYVEHRVKKKLSEIKEGEKIGKYKAGSYDRVKDKLGTRVDYNVETNEEKQLMYSVEGLTYDESDDTQWTPAHEKLVTAANEVYVKEIYCHLDTDNDGILEPVIISVCEKMVLQIQNNPYKRPPFRVSAVYRQPHRLEGKPLPLVLEDDQKELTNLTRLMTDASAESAYGTLITDDIMLAKDWSDRQVGDVLVGQYDRFKEIRPKPPGRTLLDAIEKREAKVEQKSGVSRYNQGIDANSLNKTATGINLIQTAGQQRQKFIAKRLGRTLKKVLRDVIFIIQKWPPPNEVEIVGTDIAVTPEEMAGQYDVEIDVGVGPQDRIDQSHQLEGLIQFGISAGVPMGMMGPEHLIRAQKRKGKLIGVPFTDLLVDEAQMDFVQQLQQQNQQLQQQLEQVMAQFQQLQQQGMPPLDNIIANMPDLINAKAKQMAQQMLQPHNPPGPAGGGTAGGIPNGEANRGATGGRQE